MSFVTENNVQKIKTLLRINNILSKSISYTSKNYKRQTHQLSCELEAIYTEEKHTGSLSRLHSIQTSNLKQKLQSIKI